MHDKNYDENERKNLVKLGLRSKNGKMEYNI